MVFSGLRAIHPCARKLETAEINPETRYPTALGFDLAAQHTHSRRLASLHYVVSSVPRSICCSFSLATSLGVSPANLRGFVWPLAPLAFASFPITSGMEVLLYLLFPRLNQV